MGFLMDTNVLSGIRKGARADAGVRDWFSQNVPDKLPIIDGLLAATALAHDLVLVTRNVRDVERSGVKLLNPFSEASGV